MTYQLFKSNVGGGVAEGNPVRKAIQAEHANRSAMGTVPASEFGFRTSEDIPFFVKKAYILEDEEEYYNLYIELVTGRNWEEKFSTQFRVDAVFEKLVRDYDLEVGVSNEDIREFFEEEAERLREAQDEQGLVESALDKVRGDDSDG